ncbi:NAD(P)-dependent alcohol dehydrogenase [Pseudonocardia lutea]|uniref:NAD(P)-dependent alcohol dehydrogenase n=1 Tax=Pseudonocardia lutea TaxID=2172015 RepID=A0ABW1I2W6_9PSEU
MATAPGGPFTVEPLELGEPQAREVLMRAVSVGICRTDLHIRDGEYPVPGHPVVAGHESTGVVEAVGAEVTEVAVGDHVLASFPWCGSCPACRKGRQSYCRDGFALSFGGRRPDGTTALSRLDGSPVQGHVFQQSSMATHAVVHVNNLVIAPPGTPDLAGLAPLCCGVQTGCGAVMSSPSLGPGGSLAVWGAGSVGLSAVMAGAVVGARTIVAVDTRPERLALARSLGATHVVDARADGATEQVLEIVSDGVDTGVETTGIPAVLAGALRATAMVGELVSVGAAPAGTTAPVDMNVLLNGRRLRGTIQGDATPREFLPRLLELYRDGRLPFDRMVTRFDFADVQKAVEAMESGRVVKPVLVVGEP